jgi:hypothetical protein
MRAMTKAHPQYTPGDRIITPSERTGTIQPDPWLFPGHHLIHFDTGDIHWVRTELLSPLPQDWKPTKKPRRQKKAA